MKLLKFGANWCTPCRVLEERLKGFDACELEVFDVDDEANEHYVEKFGIRGIPLLVLVDDEGNELKRWSGLVNVEDVKKEIKNMGTDA